MLDISHNNNHRDNEKQFKVEVYSKSNGTSPFRDFLISLPQKMKAKVIWTIQLLQEQGPNLREPYSSPLDYGLFELRAKLGSDIVRCIYFFYMNHIVILTNGFVKKERKTPMREIRKAKRYREDWLRRKEE